MTKTSALKADPKSAPSANHLVRHFLETRCRSEALAKPLDPRHMDIQTMADVSPTKWHLAHTTWFFEAFILQKFNPDYRVFDERFNFLFNSYYEGKGQRHPRAKRGEIKDPDIKKVLDYRASITEQMANFGAKSADPEVLKRLELGCHHEEQHQELLLTDIKHVLYFAGEKIAYGKPDPAPKAGPAKWTKIPEGIYEIGHDGNGFFFDCEAPRHKVFLQGFEVASRPVTNADYLDFIRDGGYQNPGLWLSDGWTWVQEHHQKAPLYWEEKDGAWQTFTFSGMQPMDLHAPVCHVTYYEAEAFARWAGARLPTEAEHEVAAVLRGQSEAGPIWEWTGSAYLPYPGFKANPGAVGEYNGKFMCSQMVLRGGSLATPKGHWRPTYRNFFYPASQWQLSGLRLAR